MTHLVCKGCVILQLSFHWEIKENTDREDLYCWELLDSYGAVSRSTGFLITIENVLCFVAANFVAWKTVWRIFTREQQKVLVDLCCTMSFVWHLK
jgi:hypothetical protein